MKNKANLVNCLLILGLLCFVFGCSDADSDGQTNPPTRKRSSDSVPASVSLHAAALVREFEGNEARANELYQGKRVRIHGNVNTVAAAKNGGFVLTYKTSMSTYVPAQCFFSQEDGNQLTHIQTNDEVEVEGTVLGFYQSRLSVALEDCSIP